MPTIPGVVTNDATVDNRDAILAALTAASTAKGGATARLPKGDVYTSQIDMPAGTTLLGATGASNGLAVSALKPFAAGQLCVVNFPNGIDSSGLQDITVNALPNSQANAAQHAVQVDAHRCRMENVQLIGGTDSTLFGTANGNELYAHGLYIWCFDSAAKPVKPVDTSAHDWQVELIRTSSYGSFRCNGQAHWTDVHIVASSAAPGASTAPLVVDNGNQFFANAYMDGCEGTAVIDRSAATVSSSYSGVLFLQPVPGVSGIPTIKEAAGDAHGVQMSNVTAIGPAGAGSSFASFIDAPVATTQIHQVVLPTAWTSTYSAAAQPKGSHGQIVIGTTQQQVQSGQVVLGADINGIAGAAESVVLSTPTLQPGLYQLSANVEFQNGTASAVAAASFKAGSGAFTGQVATETNVPASARAPLTLEAVVQVTAAGVINLVLFVSAAVTAGIVHATTSQGSYPGATYLSWRKLAS